jgi:hypothetical protein
MRPDHDPQGGAPDDGRESRSRPEDHPEGSPGPGRLTIFSWDPPTRTEVYREASEVGVYSRAYDTAGRLVREEERGPQGATVTAFSHWPPILVQGSHSPRPPVAATHYTYGEPGGVVAEEAVDATGQVLYGRRRTVTPCPPGGWPAAHEPTRPRTRDEDEASRGDAAAGPVD